jgi:hypothetical protein
MQRLKRLQGKSLQDAGSFSRGASPVAKYIDFEKGWHGPPADSAERKKPVKKLTKFGL